MSGGVDTLTPTTFKNTGYTADDKPFVECNPYIRDKHGFSTECKEYIEFSGSGVQQYDKENSYDEAWKIVSSPDYNSREVSVLFTCCYCGLVFKHPKRFLLHYKWHVYGSNEDPQLGPSKVDLKNTKEYFEEEIYEDQDGNVECEVCNQVFSSQKNYNCHKAQVHMAKECKICGKTFSSYGHLRAHIQTHSEGGTFPCSLCPKKFKFIHSLQRHIPTHSEEKNHQCDQCDKSFGSELLLKIHAKTHMKDLLDKHLKCSYCPKTFHQGFRLTAHERTHTGVKPFQCQDCDQSYPTNSSLTRHRKVSHSSDHPHVCFMCGKGFHIRSALEHHIRRSHLKERPHQCTDCNSAYTCQSELAKHRAKAHCGTDPGPSGDTVVKSNAVNKMKKKKMIKKRKKEYSDESS